MKLTDNFSFPEVARALRPVGLSEATITGWIQRGQVYGIAKEGPGTGRQRSYSVAGVLSLALMYQLTPLKFAPESLARWIVPSIHDAIRVAVKKRQPLKYIWLIESRNEQGTVFNVVLSNTDKPKLAGAVIVSQLDLAEKLLQVVTELEKIQATRPVDSVLPRSETVPPPQKGALYELFS